MNKLGGTLDHSDMCETKIVSTIENSIIKRYESIMMQIEDNTGYVESLHKRLDNILFPEKKAGGVEKQMVAEPLQKELTIWDVFDKIERKLSKERAKILDILERTEV